MGELKNYTVRSIHTNCSYDLAWGYLQEPLNQKEWGIHFFKDIKRVGEGYIASVPFGEIPFSIKGDKTNGCIDLYLGDGPPIHSRLIKSSEHSCLYVFILFQPPGMPDQVWENQGVPNMVEELELLKSILEQKAVLDHSEQSRAISS